MLSPSVISLFVRALYPVLIVYAATRGDTEAIIFNSALFFVTLPLWLVKDRRVLYYEALLLLLFAAALGSGYLGFTLDSSVLGWDKLFHFLAGFAVAGILLHLMPRNNSGYKWWLLSVFALSFVVFAGWEVYEWLGLELRGGAGLLTLTDTWRDFIADGLGAIVAMLIYRKKIS
jgi:uncharacterized membrane protein YjdF